MPRHETYTPEKAEYLCREVAKGRSMLAVCEDKELDVDHTTIYHWLFKHDDFHDAYIEAQKLQTQSLKESMYKDMLTENLGVLEINGKVIINTNAVGVMREKLNYIKYFRGSILGTKIKKLKNAKTAQDITDLIQELLSDGQITIEESEKLCKIAELRIKAIELQELGTRLKAIEDQQG
jgi:hypothetical protein